MLSVGKVGKDDANQGTNQCICDIKTFSKGKFGMNRKHTLNENQKDVPPSYLTPT